MRRIMLALLAVVALFYIFAPGGPDGRTPGPELASDETAANQSVLQQDLAVTDQLCRAQCLVDMREALSGMSAEDGAELSAALYRLGEHNRQLEYIRWSRAIPDSWRVEYGRIPESVSAQASAYLEEAEDRAAQGKAYESPPLTDGEFRYTVLGMPSDQEPAYLVGVARQDILKNVSKFQARNLRLAAEPIDRSAKVQTADPDTLQDVAVPDPEDKEGTSHYYRSQVVVRFAEQPGEEELAAIRREIGAQGHQRLGYTYVFQSELMDTKQLLNYFAGRENIEYAEPHFVYVTNSADAMDTGAESIVPNDSLYGKYQWNLPIIATEEGWSLSRGRDDVIVAVIDTGVDLTHPDLQPNLAPGYNVVESGKPPTDDVGHGTHVAGVISAVVNNREGVAGVTWYNKTMPIKALDHTGSGSTYWVAQGIIWATDNGAKVINLSLGNYAPAQFLHDAIKYAFDRDVVLVAASGNDNTEEPGYPAAYPEVFAVSATDSRKNKASFSNYGAYIDASAPGVSIASTYLNHQYAALSGTSMACPHVAALAALIRSVNPKLKNTEVMDIMRRTATDLGAPGKDKYYGFGQIDVIEALRQAGDSYQNDYAGDPVGVGPAAGEGFWARLMERLRLLVGVQGS